MYVQSTKDPNTALILEIILGLFGFLGIGYLYAGRTSDGLMRLIGFWVYLTVAWVTTALLTVVVIGLCCIPIVAISQIAIPVWSGLQLKKELEHFQQSSTGYYQ